MAVMTYLSANAFKYSYSFDNTPISDALVRISKDHPEVNISFIYKELDNYRTSARINTDDAYGALRQTVGLNPITIVRKDRNFYIEALQHGKFRYTGRAVGRDSQPVVAATVMLLAPKDSTVITYGITDESGRFSIPCDKRNVTAKLTCLGYMPTYRKSYIDASLRFVPNKKNSFGAVFHYSVWPPSSNYKSENIIHVSPFLWHTGNPVLKSHRSYDMGINYTFIPSDRFSFTAFANSWLVGNRAAFVYETT